LCCPAEMEPVCSRLVEWVCFPLALRCRSVPSPCKRTECSFSAGDRVRT
jgi:hypothetical protein